MQDNIASIVNKQKVPSRLPTDILMEHAGIALIHYLEKEILERGKTISDEEISKRCRLYSEALDTGFELLLKAFENPLLEQCRKLELRADNLYAGCQKLESRYRASADALERHCLSNSVTSDRTVSNIASRSCVAAHSDKERERAPSQILSSNPSEPETSPEVSLSQSQRGASDASE